MSHVSEGVVLDVGVGGANHLHHYGEGFSEVFLIDVLPEAVRSAEEQVLPHHGANNFFLHALGADLLNLPFKSSFFDGAYCLEVLQFLSEEEVRTGLSELSRVLKPGGLAGLSIAGREWREDPSFHFLRTGQDYGTYYYEREFEEKVLNEFSEVVSSHSVAWKQCVNPEFMNPMHPYYLVSEESRSKSYKHVVVAKK